MSYPGHPGEEGIRGLHACPFCGANASVFEERTGQGHGEAYSEVGVKCDDAGCGASIRKGGYLGHEVLKREGLAISQWNARN